MKWKPSVKIDNTNGLWISLGEKKRMIAEDDVIIVQKMGEGMYDDSALLKCLSEETGDSDIESSLRLAQFVVDYGEFIAEGIKPKVFNM